MEIKATPEEKKLIVNAIRKLNSVRHLNYMSMAMFTEETSIKQSKVRIVLQELIDEKHIVQYLSNTGKRVGRYYYVITDSGNETYPL